MYQGHAESDKRINLLFDDVTCHYHVIASLTEAIAKPYVYDGSKKGKYGVVRTYEHTCSYDMIVLLVFLRDLEFRVTCATDI